MTPAFTRPTKFVGPVYAKEAADALAAEKGWAFKPDGTAWRRVVPSPRPRQILEIGPISWPTSAASWPARPAPASSRSGHLADRH